MRNRGIADTRAGLCRFLRSFLPRGLGGRKAKFSLGVNAGGGPVGASSVPTWRAGFETALRFGGRWALAANVSYGTMSVRNGIVLRDRMPPARTETWADLPTTLILRYEAPLSDSTIVSLGVGAGYDSFNRTVESETNAHRKHPELDRARASFHAWAPQVEDRARDRSRQGLLVDGRDAGTSSGSPPNESTVNGVKSVQEFGFGGASIDVGARFYLF